MTDRELLKEARDLIVMCSLLDKSGQCEAMSDKIDKQLSIANVVGQSEQLPDAYNTELSNVKQLGQTQMSLNEQLQILRPFANRLGLYDAADYLRK